MEILKAVVLVWWSVSVLKASVTRQPAGWGDRDRRHIDEVLRRVVRCAAVPPRLLHAVPALLLDLERALQTRWPGCEVIPFGSMVAGVATRNSDVDCVVRLPASSPQSYETVSEARQVLSQVPALFLQLRTVPDASVPLVQFTHVPTGLRCDVNFRSWDGIRKTQMLKYLLHLDERAYELAIIVKFWAQLHKPPLAKRFMPSYGIVHLVVFYLQQRNILPPVIELQENAESVPVNGWETGFVEMPYSTTNNETLFDLMSGFFKFYADFDFESTVISTFNGTAIERRLFESSESVPRIFATYKKNVAKNLTRPLDVRKPMCIQDFFIHRQNVAVATERPVFDLFRYNLKLASKAIAEARIDFLEYIFNDDQCLRTSMKDVDLSVNNIPQIE